MAWKEVSVMGQRSELVALMRAPGGPGVAELCRRFGVSRKTAYKWAGRHRDGGGGDGGGDAYADRSRRPARSPGRCPPEVEARVVALRREHPAWGARKLRRYLIDQAGMTAVPAASTVGTILARHGLVADDARAAHTAYQRFEYPEPNDLWQMDFKGPLATAREGRCHPLCVVDDHSRYALGVRACPNEEMATVRGQLTAVFRRYGMPLGVLADNGPAWSRQSRLSVWLMRLGLRVLHGRPAHPQTQGKLERFNRTLKAEAIGCLSFGGLGDCQARFDAWREEYNHRRPHEALGMRTPASRYRASPRPFPEALPAIEYGPGDEVVTVGATGLACYAGRRWPVGAGMAALPVGIRATLTDGVKAVYFCQQKVAEIDLRERTE